MASGDEQVPLKDPSAHNVSNPDAISSQFGPSAVRTEIDRAGPSRNEETLEKPKKKVISVWNLLLHSDIVLQYNYQALKLGLHSYFQSASLAQKIALIRNLTSETWESIGWAKREDDAKADFKSLFNVELKENQANLEVADQAENHAETISMPAATDPKHQGVDESSITPSTAGATTGPAHDLNNLKEACKEFFETATARERWDLVSHNTKLLIHEYETTHGEPFSASAYQHEVFLKPDYRAFNTVNSTYQSWAAKEENLDLYGQLAKMQKTLDEIEEIGRKNARDDPELFGPYGYIALSRERPENQDVKGKQREVVGDTGVKKKLLDRDSKTQIFDESDKGEVSLENSFGHQKAIEPSGIKSAADPVSTSVTGKKPDDSGDTVLGHDKNKIGWLLTRVKSKILGSMGKVISDNSAKDRHVRARSSHS